ncbi:MAG TPA: patatin-like phospholipase family protein [Phnomibacter sp.]|nr:patatin-like phospholipase family protein [Phnomibacter sp.]
MIKNLAIKGGGVRGVAYVGAIRELDKANLLAPIERVAGTSAGALMACMICAGYTVDEIEKLMLSIQFRRFHNGWNPLRILSGYGLFSGSYIVDFTKQLLANSPKKLQPGATFMDMRNAGCKDLYAFACNVSMHTVTEFSADSTPNAPVAEAIRASMSIPFYFKAWRFEGEQSSKHIYIDGGVVYNYPLSFFDKERFNQMPTVNFESIGLYLYTQNENRKDTLNFHMPLYFTRQVFEALMVTQDYIIEEDREQMQRSVMINDLGIAATDFNISPEQCSQLMESGATATRQYIQQELKIEQSL